MKELYFVTTNDRKVNWINIVLPNYGYRAVQISDSVDEPEETNNPRIIAGYKAVSAVKKYNCPLICEDSGFFVNALGGLPGVRVHNYLNNKGINGLLKELREKADRSSYFFSVLAYMEPGFKEPVYFEEKIEGEIIEEPRGTPDLSYSWSKLHLIFIPKGKSKTIAEMSEDEFKEWRLSEDSRLKRLGEFLANKK